MRPTGREPLVPRFNRRLPVQGRPTAAKGVMSRSANALSGLSWSLQVSNQLKFMGGLGPGMWHPGCELADMQEAGHVVVA